MKPLKTILFSTALTAATSAGMLFASQSQASAATTYTVASGDTLSSISHKFAGNNNLVDQIAKNNNISNVNLIFVGEQLTIDGDQPATTQITQQTTPVATTPQVQTTTPVVAQQPVQQQQSTPVAQTTTTQQTTTQTVATTTNTTGSSAKEFIAQKESGGSYAARNGQFVGRYQLAASYLNGDYSAANQDKVADQYVTSRYGSWDAAKSFWLSNGWY